MAITTYTELKTAVANWLNRTDLTDRIPEFIALAEAKIQRRLRRTSFRTTFTVESAATNLPADCAEPRTLRLVTDAPWMDRPIPLLTPETLADRRAESPATGRPRFASAIGKELQLVPGPDMSYTMELTYFLNLVPLSATVPTNTVLQEAPDLYLYGAMQEAEPFLEHDDRAPMWTAMFDKALAELEKVRDEEEYGDTLQPARLPVVF